MRVPLSNAGANTGSGEALGLPNQKLAARKAKVVERGAPEGKRANPFDDDGEKKKKKKKEAPPKVLTQVSF